MDITQPMDITQQRPERTKKDEFFFPTDVVALLFAVLLFAVAIFGMNPTIFRRIQIPIGTSPQGSGCWPSAHFHATTFFPHTALGQPWTNMEWLSQIILFWSMIYLAGAVSSCYVGLLIALTFVLLYLLLARELRATVALGAAAISLVFVSNHFLARPHLLTFPIIVIWTACLARASEENRRPQHLAVTFDGLVDQSSRRVHTWIGTCSRVWTRGNNRCALS